METSIGFEQVVERGCGIDIHKKILVATIRGANITEETRSFDSFTRKHRRTSRLAFSE